MGILDDVYGGRWLKASSLDNDTKMIIHDWRIHTHDDGKKQIVVSFDGVDKELGLNKTNANMIAEITNSEDPDDWRGVAITVGPDKTEMGGKIVPCLRVRYEKQTTPATTPAALKPTGPFGKAEAWAEWKRAFGSKDPADAFTKAYKEMDEGLESWSDNEWRVLASKAEVDSIPF